MNPKLEFSMKVTQSDIIDIMIENKLQEHESNFTLHNETVDQLLKYYKSKKGKSDISGALKSVLKNYIKGLPGFTVNKYTQIFCNTAHHHRAFMMEYIPSGNFPNSAVHLNLYYPTSKEGYGFVVNISKSFTFNGKKHDASLAISLTDKMKKEFLDALGLTEFLSLQEETLKEYGEYIRFIKLGKRAKNRMMKQIIESTEDGQLMVNNLISKKLNSGE